MRPVVAELVVNFAKHHMAPDRKRVPARREPGLVMKDRIVLRTDSAAEVQHAGAHRSRPCALRIHHEPVGRIVEKLVAGSTKMILGNIFAKRGEAGRRNFVSREDDEQLQPRTELFCELSEIASVEVIRRMRAGPAHRGVIDIDKFTQVALLLVVESNETALLEFSDAPLASLGILRPLLVLGKSEIDRNRLTLCAALSESR